MIKLDQPQETVKQETVAVEPVPTQTQPVVQATEAPVVPQMDFVKKEDSKEDAGKAMSDQMTELVGGMFHQAAVAAVANDDEVKGEIVDKAKGAVMDEVDALTNHSKNKAKKANFLLHDDDCSNYGIDETVAPWKVRLMAVGSAFWFVVYFIIASVTVAPITIFMKGLLGAVKKIWLAVILAIVFYLLLGVGLPLLISYLSGAFGS